MSRIGCFDPTTQQWADVVVKRRDVGQRHLVMLGERLIGYIFGPDSFGGWCAVSACHPCNGMRKVDGFHRRWNAVEYLLEVGVRPPETRSPLSP